MRKLFNLRNYRLFSSYQTNNINNLTSEVTREIDIKSIEEIIKIAPEANKFPTSVWQKTFSTLINQGFKSKRFSHVIANYPEILTMSSNKIENSLNCWRSCQFGGNKTILLIEKYPQLLKITDERQLLTKIGYLLSYTEKKNNLWKLLMNSPNVIYDKESVLKEKIDYLERKMRADINEIINSSALSNSIFNIKCRHIFLERLGLFKLKSLKPEKNIVNNNPKLSQITDTSDKRFAVKVAFVTLDEYDAFKELFKREIDEQFDNLHNSDEELDHDEEENEKE